MQISPSFFQNFNQASTSHLITSLSQEVFQATTRSVLLKPKVNPLATLGAVKSLQQQINQERRMKASSEDPMVQERMSKLLRMENLADITLAGFAIKLIRLTGPMAFNDLSLEVSKCYDALRRSDGSKYTGNYVKALKGCLSSSDVFCEKPGNIWAIDEEKAQIYERTTTTKIKEAVRKQTGKNKKADKECSIIEDDGHSIASTKNSLKRSLPASNNKVFDTLDSVCKAFRAEGKTQFYQPDILTELRGDEAPLQLLRNWGKERLTGVLQCFEFFAPVLQDYMRLKAAEESREVSTFGDFIGNNHKANLELNLPMLPDHNSISNADMSYQETSRQIDFMIPDEMKGL